MKLFILGLIILLILVCQIYKIIQEKNPKEKKIIEKMTEKEYRENVKHNNEFIDGTIDYYNKLKDGRQFELDKKLDSDIGKDFVYLDSKDRLIFHNKSKYLKSKKQEGFHGDNVRKGISKDIDKCRAIKKCGLLDTPGYEHCGYCGKLGDKNGYPNSDTQGYNQDGKFDYMPNATGGKEIGPDVCPSDALEANPPKTSGDPMKSPVKKQLGNRWATTAYDCEKIQLQDKCSEVKNCGELNDMDGLGKICGWCPADKAYPRDDDFGILYSEDNIVNNYALYSDKAGKTQVKGDRCGALNETYRDANGKLKSYFPSLQKAADCSICDNSGGQITIETSGGATRPAWSDACVQDLWAGDTGAVKGSGKLSSKILVKCSTYYDEDPNADSGGIYGKNYGDKDPATRLDNGANYNWGFQKWYKVQNDMRQQVTYPLFNFKKDYNTRINKTSPILAWTYGDGEDNGKSTDLDEKGDLLRENEYRRSYIMNDELDDEASKYRKSEHTYPDLRIDKKWKQCFNKENKNNKLKCVPIRDLREAKNIIYKRTGDNYDYTDLATWETRCAYLKNENKCEIKEKYPNGSLVGGSLVGGSLVGGEIMCKEIK